MYALNSLWLLVGGDCLRSSDLLCIQSIFKNSQKQKYRQWIGKEESEKETDNSFATNDE